MGPTTREPERVLVYSLSWLPGQVDGIAVRMMAHVKELAARGVQVTLITPSYVLRPEAATPNHELVTGVEHIVLDTMPMPIYEKNSCAACTFKNFFTVLEAIRRTRPDLVHCTQCASLMVFVSACIREGVPMVVSMHTDVTQIVARDGSFSCGASGRGAWVLNALALYCTNLGYRVVGNFGVTFFPVSTQARKILTDASVPESLIAPYAWGPMVDRGTFRIDLPEAEVAAARERLTFGLPDAYLLVYVGRVTAEKDVQFLVDALERAPRSVVLALIGSGSMVADLKKLHGPTHRLHCSGDFVGREEVATALRAADCCVSASTMETVGFTAMEALSCGTPMLAANAQGFAEHLSHGTNARLFAPGDAASFDRELADIMATRREGSWTREALRASMEHASLSECTQRALRAYEVVKPLRRSLFSLAWSLSILLSNVMLTHTFRAFKLKL